MLAAYLAAADRWTGTPPRCNGINRLTKCRCHVHNFILLMAIRWLRIHLPNAVKISPPCCLVKLTTRTIDESADWDVGGKTNDVGNGPAIHSIGISRCIDIQLPLKSLCKFTNANNRMPTNESRVVIRVVFGMVESAAVEFAALFVAWVNEAIIFMSNELKLIISNAAAHNWFPRCHQHFMIASCQCCH